jgi:hypothetical protein
MFASPNREQEVWSPSLAVDTAFLTEGRHQWRTEGGSGVQPSLRNSEVLTKLSQIPSSVENTFTTT